MVGSVNKGLSENKILSLPSISYKSAENGSTDQWVHIPLILSNPFCLDCYVDSLLNFISDVLFACWILRMAIPWFHYHVSIYITVIVFVSGCWQTRYLFCHQWFIFFPFITGISSDLLFLPEKCGLSYPNFGKIFPNRLINQWEDLPLTIIVPIIHYPYCLYIYI